MRRGLANNTVIFHTDAVSVTFSVKTKADQSLSKDSENRSSGRSVFELIRQQFKKIHLPKKGRTPPIPQHLNIDMTSSEKKRTVPELLIEEENNDANGSDRQEDSTKQILKELYNIQAPARALPVRIELWDLGGQIIFYTTHQHVLSSRSLYLLLLDLSRDLQNVVQDETLDPLQRRQMSVKGMYFNSIILKLYCRYEYTGLV